MGEVEESKRIHFLRKPLFFWSKSFAENEVRREDSFSKFIGSDVLNYVLEYIGIPTESDQSSLHLSSIFDEENSMSVSSLQSSTSSSSRSTKVEVETKQRIQKLNRIFNQLRSHYEEHFNQLVLLPPPNAPHVSSTCHSCGIDEFERILLLLLGAATQGTQKQETMRKIREFPTQIQQDLIRAIKQVTDTPDIFPITPWTQFGKLSGEEQKNIYDSLLGHLRRLIYERNEAFQSRYLAEFGCGLTNCEQRRELELRGYEGLDFEKYYDENRSNAAMRQLREELLEKSDLLKECRDELEMMKTKLADTQQQLTETEKQLKTFKMSRDEFDVLREGKEKAIRLEAEVVRMKKKLEEAEQFYEQVEILQNENRTYQRKHAILMDQINMLTVEKERLEISFMTQSTHHRSPHPKHSAMSDEEEPRSFNYVPNITHYPDELLLDSDEEKGNVAQKTEADGHGKVTGDNVPHPITPTPTPLIVVSIVDPAADEVVTAPPTPKYKDAETQNNGSRELLTETPTTTTTTSLGKSPREGRSGGPKRGHRRSRGGHGKRTKKSSIFPHHPKVILRKVTNFGMETQDPFPEQPEQGSSGKKKSHRRGHSIKSRRSAEMTRQPTPTRRRPLDHTPESDADEELSMSPNPNYERSSWSDLEPEIRNSTNELPRIPFEHFQHQEEIGSEDELFFVCSTVHPPAMARNVRIYAPSRDPHPYHHHQSEFYRQSPIQISHLGSPILNLHGHGHGHHQRHFESPEVPFGEPIRRSPEEEVDEDGGGALISRCSIEVNLRHGNSNQFRLLEPEHEGYGEESRVRHHQSIHGLGQEPIRTHPNGTNPGSTTEEDEDSVWYEYGCV